jgi:hypothetical protein
VPIKILLERDSSSSEMNITEIPKSLSPQTRRVCHITTEVLLVLETNHASYRNNHTQHVAENYTDCCMCCTGQTDGACRLDRWRRSGRSATPVRLVDTTTAKKRPRTS